MYSKIKKIALELEKEPVLLFFSCGKDSIVSLDLFCKYYRGEITVIFFYFVDGLEIKEKILRWYENKYNIKIVREPDFKIVKYESDKKSYNLGRYENYLRDKYNISYIVRGDKKVDSFSRRGYLSKLHDGIDKKYLKLYPVMDWSNKQIFSYVKFNKLLLPDEYKAGFDRDFYIPNSEKMLYLKNNYYNDYLKVIAKYPEFEAMALRREYHGSE